MLPKAFSLKPAGSKYSVVWFAWKVLLVICAFLAHSTSFLALHWSPSEIFGPPYVGRLQQPQEQRYQFLTVHAVFLWVQTQVGLPVLWIFNVRAVVNAGDCTRGCTDTVRESAANIDSGRKISCRTEESNLPQQRAGPTLYQRSYNANPPFFCLFSSHLWT